MIKKALLLMVTVVLLISCKDKVATAEEKPDTFTFTLNAIVKKQDDFQVFYKEGTDTAAPYEEVHSVWVGVKGNENAQNIVINLPEGVYPTQIRFDFGQKKQEEIVINNLDISYKDKSVAIKGAEFFNYFTPDENFVKIDKLNSKIIPVELAGGKFDPMFYSNTDFTTRLSTMTK